MTNDKVDEALRVVVVRYRDYDARRCSPESIESDSYSQRCHLVWMATEALTWGPERLEKKFRWLGFVQGVMWSLGDSSVDELKNVNKPKEMA